MMHDEFLLHSDHPILEGHRVHGHRLLPGMAYIDILFQFFREAGYTFQELELGNLSIHRPLMVAVDKPVLVSIESLEKRSGEWQVRLYAGESGNGTTGARQLLVAAEMRRRAATAFGERLDLESLAGKPAVDLEELYAACRRRDLIHAGFIKGEGRIFELEECFLVEARLGPDTTASADDHLFHPTLLDACAIGAGLALGLADAEPEKLFLPLSYEAFRASHSLGTQCWARITKSSVHRGAEVAKLSLELFDAAGAKIGELTNSAVKAVRSSKLADVSAAEPAYRRNGASRRAGSAEVAATVAAPRAPHRVEGAESFLREIFAAQLGCPLEDIDAARGYYDMGLDSAGLLALAQRIEAKIGVSLSPTLLFEFPTIGELARYLDDAYATKLPTGSRSELAEMPVDREERQLQAPIADDDRPAAKPTAVTEIAVIGLAGRYPGAADIAAFWENLKAGKDSVTEIPASRWDWQEFAAWETASGKKISKWGGFLDDVECFDAGFFRISPAEAELVDPQERHFLEMAWSAIEDAGYTPSGLAQPRGAGKRRKVGVFAGVMHKDYMLLGAEAAARGQRVPVSLNFAQIANRVSYHCNFHGPSLVVDTVCSSSLTAVHLALESLRHGECEVALAGGVNLTLHPEKYLTYGMLDMHASDGRCRSFGAGGDGYVSSEGVGVVVLKPLEKAIADGDHIYATIKASVINHGGTVSGMTVPSPVAQAEMVTECLEKAGVSAATISYIEAHGTGTALGDPIELHGLTKAFGAFEKPICAIGSVKSNIGHAESAAGISGLSKVILQLHHRTLVPSLHSTQSNPLLDFAGTPFYLQQKSEPWLQPIAANDGRETRYPRRAGLSSFGATGSNAHVILEEYAATDARPQPSVLGGTRVRLVPLSARNEDRLRVQAKNLIDHLRRSEPRADSPASTIDLTDLAYTLQVGRVGLAQRVIFAVEDLPSLIRALEQFTAGERTVPCCWQGSVKTAEKLVALIGNDEEGKTMVARWIAKGELEKLAELWVAGLELDWLSLYGRQKPRRISLPSYPFAREKYWLPRGPAPVAKKAALQPAAASDAGLLLMQPLWRPMEVDAVSTDSFDGKRWTVLCDLHDAWTDLAATERAAGADWIVLKPVGKTLSERFESCAVALLPKIQGFFKDAPAGRSLMQVVVPWNGEDDLSGNEVFLGLSGITRAAHLENPRLIGQVILLPRATPIERLKEILEENSRRLSDREIRYQEGKRTVLGWREAEPIETAPDRWWKRDAAYLITGGLGGLGGIFAEEIARRAPGAKLILTGRSPCTPERERQVLQLHARGAEAEYRQVDLAQPGAIAALIRELEEKRYNIRGVLHSAGVIRDRFILQKTAAEVREVFAPKVHGLLELDEATKGLELDFFVLFSSGAGAMGNIGQADYAAANGFMDAFAGYRQKRVERKERSGRTLSLDWPLWKDGGMQVSAEIEAAMKASVGMVPMQTANGLTAFYRAMSSTQTRVLVAEGNVDRLRQFWLNAGVAPLAVATPTMAWEGDAATAREAVLLRLKRVFSAVTKHPLDQLQADELLESYGIDSIVITQLNRELAGSFSNVSKTLFYEQRTLSAVAAYLMKEHSAECRQWGGEEGSAPAVAAPSAHEPPQPVAARTLDLPLRRAVEPIAIIGMSGQFPGARNLAEFWENLKAGKDCVTEVPPDRWSIDGFFEPDREKALVEGKSYSKWGAFLEGFADFDAGFFKLSPREALMIDPQERLFLQEAWRALEDAGYAASKLDDELRQACGVYCGVTKSSFNLRSDPAAGIYCNTSFASLVNRVSYTLDLRGPSVPVDAMCSSAMVALHQACEALQRGELRMALVGAVNLYLHPQSFVALAQNKLLSGAATPQVFSSGGDGFVPSEGVGAVVLKRLSDAERDGDAVLAVIRATAVNHGGKTHGYAVPNPAQQAAAMEKALATAGLEPAAIDYIECAANGSEMGDAIEISALKQVFGNGGKRDKYRIGSAKSLLGHGEAVSGLAQLFKVVLQLRHRALCPTRWTPSPGRDIDFAALPFEIQTHATEWTPAQASETPTPLRAGINSFGAGGVNAHVIVEEFRPTAPYEKSPPAAVLFVLSARTESALERSVAAWKNYSASIADSDFDLEAIAWRLQTGRDEMKHRFACVVTSRSELIACLASVGNGQPYSSAFRGVAAGDKRAARTETAPDVLPAPTHLERVAEQWVAGGAVSWRELYLRPPVRPVTHLPTYPFERRRHWFEAKSSSNGVGHPNESGPSILPVSDANGHGTASAVRFMSLEELAAMTPTAHEPEAIFVPVTAARRKLDVEEIRTAMQSLLKKMLFHDPAEDLDVHASFEELGLSSVFVAPFVQHLAREFQLELRETIVFDYSTVDKLSHYIAEQLVLAGESRSIP